MPETTFGLRHRIQVGRVTMKDLPCEERPRERLMALGPESLSNVEILALLIGSGTKTRSAMELALQLLNALGSFGVGNGDDNGALARLASASVEELQSVKGIGPARAALIKAAVELGRRLNLKPSARPYIRSSADARRLLEESMRHLEKEHFLTILLDSKNRVLGVEVVSVGSLDEAVVHPREVFKAGVRRSAAALMLAHNHPSGDPTPSAEDLAVTARLIEAGRILGIDVLDHLIFGNGRVLSLRETRKEYWAC